MVDLVQSPFTSGNLSSDLIGIVGAERFGGFSLTAGKAAT